MTSEVTIRAATEADRAAWDAFVDQHPEGSLYQMYGWRDINEKVLRHATHFLVASRRDQVLGVLPLVLVTSRLFGRILCSMPFLNQGGVCGADPAIEKSLVDSAMALGKELGVDYLELRCAHPRSVELPVSLRKVNFAVPLQSDPDALFESFAKSHRRNIRRAYKEGLEVRSGGVELFADFREVIQPLWHSLGTPQYKPRFFEEVLRTFPERTRIFSVHHGKQVVAAMLVGYGNGSAESMWGGSHPKFKHLDGNYVLYWEMIRDSCLRGLRTFSLGRSTANSGGQQFKLKWNAQIQQQYWYVYKPDGGELPQLNVDNANFRLAIDIWKRLPLPVVRTIGPLLARLIP